MDAEVLCSTPVGVLHKGDRFWYLRAGAWPTKVTATGVSGNGKFVYARAGSELARVVLVAAITRIEHHE